MKTGKQKNKRSMTLFELLIVLSLIATAFGMLTLQISKTLKGEQFERSVEQVISKIALAQELMLDFHTDVQLILTKEDEKPLECKLQVATQLPQQLETAINRYHTIQGIETLAFDEDVRNSIELCFDATLGTIPKGKLVLTGKGKEETILLDGYPAHIKRGAHGREQTCKATYPQECLSAF